MQELAIRITRTDEAFADLALPRYATAGSAGMDISAALNEPLTLAPRAIVMVPTALAIALPQGFEAQIRSRSGLAARHGVFALNAPGTIDSDYRGEISVILANFGTEPFVLQRGDRIAQMIIASYSRVQWEQVETLDATDRADGGFGSTGVSEAL